MTTPTPAGLRVLITMQSYEDFLSFIQHVEEPDYIAVAKDPVYAKGPWYFTAVCGPLDGAITLVKLVMGLEADFANKLSDLKEHAGNAGIPIIHGHVELI